MFSSETLGKCAVIKIIDLLPKKIKTSDGSTNLKDSFLFLAKSQSKLLVYQNLWLPFTEEESEKLKRYISTWGGGETVDIRNGVLEMELPSFLVPFVDEISSIPGARLSPNLLRISGDVYFCVEFHPATNLKVSEVVINFLSRDHIFTKELIYIGDQVNNIPFLLNLYKENGNSYDNFVLLSNVWEFTEEEIRNQNLGIFQNHGTFVPKFFVDNSTDKLIFKLDHRGILGKGKSVVVDEKDNLVEIEITSKFFSDFYNEIIRSYCGPIFYHVYVNESRETSYYLVEKGIEALFIKGLLKLFNKDPRSEHRNYILKFQKLGEVLGERMNKAN
jgi:hypothetical protein